jgi:hypothetical protein
LLARIGSADRLPEKRDHILLDLARRACQGDARVDRDQFFADHGLDGTPLTAWFSLAEKAQGYLAGVLKRKRIDLFEDPRPHLTRDLLDRCTASAPILVLTGESGSGKTWHALGVISAAAELGMVPLLVDSRGDADRDLVEAKNTFWHSIVGVDEAPPLSRLRPRLQQLHSAHANRQLILLVDNVADLDEARGLIQSDWEGWGIRVLMTCPPGVAQALPAYLGSRGRVASVPDFTLPELYRYLSQVAGVAWENVPYGVLRMLRRPLLAALFRDLVPATAWEPYNEYELYERSWAELRDRRVVPFDLDALRQLMGSILLAGSRYPWTVSELRASGLDGAGLDRLTRAGWLRETASGGYEVWHERLLNWGVAQAVIHDLRHHPDYVESHTQAVAELLVHPWAPCGVSLASVLMDVLWALASPEFPAPDVFRRLVERCETRLGWQTWDTLYKNLLPTLGHRAAPFLLERLRTTAGIDPRYQVSVVADALVATGVEDLPTLAEELLADLSPKVRRAAALLLAQEPSPSALERLWSMHTDGFRDPNPVSLGARRRVDIVFGHLRSPEGMLTDRPRLARIGHP